MAADAVDAAAEDLPARVSPIHAPRRCRCWVREGYHALVNQTGPDRRRTTVCTPTGSGICSIATVRRSTRCSRSPTAIARLLTPIPGAPDYLEVEALYAAAHEGALHVEDVLARRTRISIEYSAPGSETAPRVAELMAGCWAGRRRRRPRGRRPNSPGGGRSGSRRPSPTTPRRTRCAPLPPRRAPRSSNRYR